MTGKQGAGRFAQSEEQSFRTPEESDIVPADQMTQVPECSSLGTLDKPLDKHLDHRYTVRIARWVEIHWGIHRAGIQR